jgi:DNA (cytosine-5)-methyltransferase 1
MKQLTTAGYSARAAVVKFADYGVSQRRARLVVFAACPGQQLPDFPKPTHSANAEHTGLQPWVTCNEAIANIPASWPDHDAHDPRRYRQNGKEWDGNKICPTLTTKNSFGHPEGWRSFTIRELACIQSFPLYHEFVETQGSTSKEKQIGNAIPPKAFKLFLDHIRKFLLACDDPRKYSFP